MSSPRVSVIIPTYNRAGLLQRAIESVLTQTFADLEVIVVDDGSDDGTENVLPTDARVVLIKLEHSGKLGVVRNAGLALARGEFVAWLDSDDVWLPQKLERRVALLDTQRGVGLVCTNARVIDANGRETRSHYLQVAPGSTGSVLEQLLSRQLRDRLSASLSHDAKARRARRRFHRRSDALRAVEDYDLWLRLALVSELAYLPEPLALYCDHATSIRREISRANYWRSLLRILPIAVSTCGRGRNGPAAPSRDGTSILRPLPNRAC